MKKKYVKEERLKESFFRENPLEPLSAALFGQFMITLFFNGKLEEEITRLADPAVDDDRRQTIERQKTLIEQTDDPAALVEIARKGCDVFNQRLLCEKIVERQELAMPLLLKRYRTCALDHFIDTSMYVLVMTDDRYARELLDMYDQIRCPYARACACLVFGMKHMEDTMPLLLREYERFGEEYPEESFDQHPLLALYILHGKA